MSSPTRSTVANWADLAGTPFEEFLVKVFEAIGYAAEAKGAQTLRTRGDKGVDLVVTAGANRIAVQAKGYPAGGRPGIDAVREAHSGKEWYGCSSCMVVTNSTFTTEARDLAAKVRCRLVDRDDIPRLIDGKVLPFYPSMLVTACLYCRGDVRFETAVARSVVRCPRCFGAFVAPRPTFSPSKLFAAAKECTNGGDYPAASRILKRLKTTHPYFQAPVVFVAEGQYALRQYANALRMFRQALQLGPLNPLEYEHAAHTACECEEYVEAERIFRAAQEAHGRDAITGRLWFVRGCIAAQRGEPRAAVKYLRHGFKRGFIDLDRYRVEHRLNPVRGQRGFRNLLARLAGECRLKQITGA